MALFSDIAVDGSSEPRKRDRVRLRACDSAASSSYGSASGAYGAEGPVAVARLLADGTPDPSFGGARLTASPKLIFNPFYMTHMLGQLCDGTVLLAGRVDVVPLTNQDMGLIKLDPTGVAVSSFGTVGIASLPLAANQIFIGAAQDPKSGKVVLIGRTEVGGELVGARFNP